MRHAFIKTLILCVPSSFLSLILMLGVLLWMLLAVFSSDTVYALEDQAAELKAPLKLTAPSTNTKSSTILTVPSTEPLTTPLTTRLSVSAVPESNAWVLNDIEVEQENYYKNIGNDGFLVFKGLNLTRADVCGLLFDVEFKEPPLTPVLMEVFWRSKHRSFSETQKGFFIVNNKLDKKAHQFVVPLCKLYRFSGGINEPAHQENIDAIRIDYPSKRTISLKFNNFELLDAQSTFASSLPMLEPYERINAKEFASIDVMIPKLIFIVQHGFSRLTKDTFFLVFWLLLIVGLMSLIIKSLFNQRSE